MRAWLFPSNIAQEYFAVNDDGRGLERGAITHAIAKTYTAEELKKLFGAYITVTEQ